MNNKIVELEGIEIRLALEDRINIINKHIAECEASGLLGYVTYWKDKREIAQSALNKLRKTILFMAGE